MVFFNMGSNLESKNAYFFFQVIQINNELVISNVTSIIYILITFSENKFLF